MTRIDEAKRVKELLEKNKIKKAVLNKVAILTDSSTCYCDESGNRLGKEVYSKIIMQFRNATFQWKHSKYKKNVQALVESWVGLVGNYTEQVKVHQAIEELLKMPDDKNDNYIRQAEDLIKDTELKFQTLLDSGLYGNLSVYNNAITESKKIAEALGAIIDNVSDGAKECLVRFTIEFQSWRNDAVIDMNNSDRVFKVLNDWSELSSVKVAKRKKQHLVLQNSSSKFVCDKESTGILVLAVENIENVKNARIFFNNIKNKLNDVQREITLSSSWEKQEQMVKEKIENDSIKLEDGRAQMKRIYQMKNTYEQMNNLKAVYEQLQRIQTAIDSLKLLPIKQAGLYKDIDFRQLNQYMNGGESGDVGAEIDAITRFVDGEINKIYNHSQGDL